MSEKQKQFITIVRLFDLTQGIMGIIISLVMLMYVLFFSFLGVASSTSTSASEAQAGAAVGIVFVVIFGVIALISLLMTGLNFYLAWKLEEPKKWIWTAQVIITCLQFLNLYYLPVNIYFLIQLLKPEYKEYYSE